MPGVADGAGSWLDGSGEVVADPDRVGLDDAARDDVLVDELLEPAAEFDDGSVPFPPPDSSVVGAVADGTREVSESPRTLLAKLPSRENGLWPSVIAEATELIDKVVTASAAMAPTCQRRRLRRPVLGRAPGVSSISSTQLLSIALSSSESTRWRPPSWSSSRSSSWIPSSDGVMPWHRPRQPSCAGGRAHDAGRLARRRASCPGRRRSLRRTCRPPRGG